MKSLPDGEERPSSLDQARLTSALPGPPALWREIRVVGETGSTNADLLAQARSGTREGLVLVAEAQTAGRGRMGRHWISAPGAALTFSVLLRPGGVPPGLLGWMPLLAGVAVVSALREEAGVDARLKWPNDVLVGDAKLAGILAESRAEAIVVGIGINVFQRREELPVDTATSLLLETQAHEPEQGEPAPGGQVQGGPLAGAGGDARGRLLLAVLGEFARWYRAWLDQGSPGDADSCGLRQEYLRWCATVGREVTVSLPGGRSLTGTAAGIGAAGCLELRTGSGVVQVSAGDVVHLR
jgi:BirA family transcriptional regulator, biotin operon repressor / biotin---[acetyl-CoA-carboxylase] ligase